MKKNDSTVVINDTDDIWSNCQDYNDRFYLNECNADGQSLVLDIYCNEECLLYGDVFNFENAQVLLAIKSDDDGIQLAYQFYGSGWNSTYVSCDDPDALHNTDVMKFSATLRNDCFRFVRDEDIPEEFACALRCAIQHNHSDAETDSEGIDQTDVLDNPDIACVIPDRLSRSENELQRPNEATAQMGGNTIDNPTVPNDLYRVSHTSGNYKMPEWAKQFSKDTNVPAVSSPVSVDFTDSEFAVLTVILGGTLFNITQLARIPVAFMGVQDAEQVYFKLHGVDKASLVEKCRLLNSWEQITLAVRILESYCSENKDIYI